MGNFRSIVSDLRTLVDEHDEIDDRDNDFNDD